MIKKKRFVIKNSQPPVAHCKNRLNRRGELTVASPPSLHAAWRTVLKVLGLGVDGQPLRRAPPVYVDALEVTAGKGGPLLEGTPDLRDGGAKEDACAKPFSIHSGDEAILNAYAYSPDAAEVSADEVSSNEPPLEDIELPREQH